MKCVRNNLDPELLSFTEIDPVLASGCQAIRPTSDISGILEREVVAEVFQREIAAVLVQVKFKIWNNLPGLNGKSVFSCLILHFASSLDDTALCTICATAQF